jgi:hypothetical protein
MWFDREMTKAHGISPREPERRAHLGDENLYKKIIFNFYQLSDYEILKIDFAPWSLLMYVYI